MSGKDSNTSTRKNRKHRQKRRQRNANLAEAQHEERSTRCYELKRKIACVYFIQPYWAKCPLSFFVWLPFGFSAPIAILSCFKIEGEIVPFIFFLGFGALLIMGVSKVEKYVEGKLLRHEPLARFVWGYHLLALAGSILSFSLL